MLFCIHYTYDSVQSLEPTSGMKFALSNSFRLFTILLLPLGCAQLPSTHLQLEQFWQHRPTDDHSLALAGYDRTFAINASPALIDEMITDLENRPAGERFETYALVAYYMPRPATTDHLAKLQQSSTGNTRRWVERFLQRLAELKAPRIPSNT